MTYFDPLGVYLADAALHTARESLRERLAAERNPRRHRQIKNIESAVMDAIGAVSRQGLTVDEFQVAATRLRAG